MMRLLEATVFVFLAAGLHVGLLGLAPLSGPGTSGGDNGANQLSLAPATPELAAAVAIWQAPPPVAQSVMALATPGVDGTAIQPRAVPGQRPPASTPEQVALRHSGSRQAERRDG